jgi:hypothetical protein
MRVEAAVNRTGSQVFFRPFAAIGHHLKMLQRGPSLRPFVQSAAFCRLKRRCADEADPENFG